jgi:hypothetical protein
MTHPVKPGTLAGSTALASGNGSTVMAGEHAHAQEVVAAAFAAAEQGAGMSADAMGRALIQAVVERYLTYRTPADVGSELSYLAESLDDDAPVVTRGC